jgi:hypothetical protein
MFSKFEKYHNIYFYEDIVMMDFSYIMGMKMKLKHFLAIANGHHPSAP